MKFELMILAQTRTDTHMCESQLSQIETAVQRLTGTILLEKKNVFPIKPKKLYKKVKINRLLRAHMIMHTRSKNQAHHNLIEVEVR